MSAKSTHKRYPFAPLQEGAFFFPTDKGCYYTVQFSKSAEKLGDSTLLLNNGEVYEISFDSQCDDEEDYDESVSNTLIYIISTNLVSRGDTAVHFIVCDNADGRGKLRSRLFDFWYVDIVKEIPTLKKVNYTLPVTDDEEYYISLFIFENHPEYKRYCEEFENNLSENFNKR